ncbi:MAG: GNAT family N-acetyltransferase [Candidatus Caldatribacteriaceae bacterium]
MKEKILHFRRAREEDLTQITEIYNQAVLYTTATFHLYPRSIEEQEAWYQMHGERYPLIVAEENGTVVAWACLSPYSDREGYQYTVSDSIYVREEFRRQRIGYELLSYLLEEAKKLGYHSVVAFIARENIPSVRLHEKLGFEFRGVLREVGFKFQRWVDICIYQKMLESAPGRKVPQPGCLDGGGSL